MPNPFGNFNSIKVQLKLTDDVHERIMAQFQFHKGTIKTSETQSRTIAAVRFQFHKGTIKTV